MEDIEGLLPGEDKEAAMGEPVLHAPRHAKWIPSMFCAGLFMFLVSFIVTVVNIAHVAKADDFCFKRSTYYSKIYNYSPFFLAVSCSVSFPHSSSSINCYLLNQRAFLWNIEH